MGGNEQHAVKRELIERVARAVSVPLIASGGVGKLDDLADGLIAGADAVLAASIFHFGQHTIGEADPFLPDAERVAVKESFTRFGAWNVHPEMAREMIAAGARRAVERAKVASGGVWEAASDELGRRGGNGDTALRLPAIPRPATLEVHMQTADMAEVASWLKGAERTGVRTVTIAGDDPLAMFRSFVGVTYITRVAEGR